MLILCSTIKFNNSATNEEIYLVCQEMLHSLGAFGCVYCDKIIIVKFNGGVWGRVLRTHCAFEELYF